MSLPPIPHYLQLRLIPPKPCYGISPIRDAYFWQLVDALHPTTYITGSTVDSRIESFQPSYYSHYNNASVYECYNILYIVYS